MLSVPQEIGAAGCAPPNDFASLFMAAVASRDDRYAEPGMFADPRASETGNFKAEWRIEALISQRLNAFGALN